MKQISHYETRNNELCILAKNKPKSAFKTQQFSKYMKSISAYIKNIEIYFITQYNDAIRNRLLHGKFTTIYVPMKRRFENESEGRKLKG